MCTEIPRGETFLTISEFWKPSLIPIIPHIEFHALPRALRCADAALGGDVSRGRRFQWEGAYPTLNLFELFSADAFPHPSISSRGQEKARFRKAPTILR